MPEFAFTARDAAGHNVDGVMTAADKRGVLSALAERSLCAVSVRAKTTVALSFRRNAAVKPPRWPPTWPNSPTCCKMACPCSKR